MTYREREREGGLYRARNTSLLGVCKGLAAHLDVSVVGVRVAVILATIFTGVWPGCLCYAAAAFIMKPQPVLPIETMDEREFYHSYTSSRTMALHRLKKTYDALDRRIQRIESIVTAPAYDWDRRLDD